VQCVLSKEKFGLESILFVHLKALQGGEVHGRNSWNGRTWRDPLWNTEQKMALTLRPQQQVYCSPSSTNQDTILLSKQNNLDLKPHCII